VPIRSLEFRDFWVLDISQPSHSTREAGGPSTVGVGVARTPRKPFLDCHRRCQASRTRLLHPVCDLCAHNIAPSAPTACRARSCSSRGTMDGSAGQNSAETGTAAFRVLRGERECFFTPRCEQIRIRLVKTLTLASPSRAWPGLLFCSSQCRTCPAFAVREQPPAAGLSPGAHGHARFHTEDIIPRRMWLAGFHIWAHNLPAVAAKLTSFAASY